LPTKTGNVETVGPDQWASRGVLFDKLVAPLRQFGPQGVRAVLWHQGESDANQSQTDRTLSGNLYREYLEKVIRESRREAGWEVPWFVAQVSYHSPDDTHTDDIRAAQKSLWDDKIAFEGPDTDTLTGDNRDRGGKGIHLSAKGLAAHGQMWAEKVAAVIDRAADAASGDAKPAKDNQAPK
jgi:Carbohydrate esterase, sialic acid-specific acetylesterase